MNPRARVLLVVALAAVGAAGLAVAAGLSGRVPDAPVASTQAALREREGVPPLRLDLGVRTDAEARDLARAAELYRRGELARARALFRRHDSLEARVGAALAAWPEGLDRLEQLAALHPRSAVVQLHLGLARFWAGRANAIDAWREAARVEPDTPYAIAAGDLLHPRYAQGLPIFVPGFELPRRLTAARLARLERAARGGGVRDLLAYGVALQVLGRSVSARRVYDEAARAAPGNAEAQVAAAVARFDKDEPAAAFSLLGPLARRFPGEPTVRFHLGLLLLWAGEVEEARAQLRRAARLRPGSRLAREASAYLRRLDELSPASGRAEPGREEDSAR